jgi:histidinol-phosphate/aromatic aminotransferase/cobyric acid decarboxylase-like protein
MQQRHPQSQAHPEAGGTGRDAPRVRPHLGKGVTGTLDHDVFGLRGLVAHRRLTVGTPADNAAFLAAIREALT